MSSEGDLNAIDIAPDDADPQQEVLEQMELEVDSEDEILNVPKQSGTDIGANDGELELHRCIECKLLPFGAIFQCANEHLICAGCYQKRVLDKMLGYRMGTCPECAVRIFRHTRDRKVECERWLAQLMVRCEKCEQQLPRGSLHHHQRYECAKRFMLCKYKRIGCNWRDQASEYSAHVANCAHRTMKGRELLPQLRQLEEQRCHKRSLLQSILRLLQLPQLTVRLLHLKAQQPRDSPTTSPLLVFSFWAYTLPWSLLLHWEAPDEPQAAAAACSLSFQLRLDYAELDGILPLTYTLASGIYSDVRFQLNLCEKFEFSRHHCLGPSLVIYENAWENCHRLLHERGFYARLLMAGSH